MTADQFVIRVLGAVLLGMILLVWGIDIFRRYAGPRLKSVAMWVSIGIAITAIGWGVFIDFGHRRETLHEVILKGTLLDGATTADAQDMVTERSTEFTVIHSRQSHTLKVVPQYKVGTPRFNRRSFPVDVSFQLIAPDGTPIIDEEQRLQKRHQKLHWSSGTLKFIPPIEGIYTLHLQIRTAGVPEVRVRITDPLYTEGKRVKGF